MSVHPAEKPRSIYLVRKFVEPIIAQLVLHKKHYRYTASDADGKADYVDERESFVSQKVSKCNLEIILQHVLPPIFNGTYKAYG
jgi:hypothetical protein